MNYWYEVTASIEPIKFARASCFHAKPLSTIMRQSRSRLRATFRKYDVDSSGELSLKELGSALSDLGCPTSEAELIGVFKKVDVNGSSSVSFQEFCTLFDEASLRHVFKQFDCDNSGCITVEELRKALAALDVHVTAQQAQTLLAAVDTSKDGVVSFDEFKKFFETVPMADLRRVSQKWLQLSGIDTGSDLSVPVPPSHLPLWRFVLAGGLGGVFSRTATAPLERVRIEAQVGDSVRGVFSSMRHIASTSGNGWRALFAGNGANCLRVFPHAGVACLTYASLVKFLPSDGQLDRYEYLWRASAGGCAGVVATVCTYPLDVVRTRLAVHGNQAEYRTVTSALRHVYATGNLWKGIRPTLYAVAPFVAIQQATYDVIKMSAMEYGQVKPSVGFFLTCGAAAGLCAQSVVYPLDMVRRRMQADVVSTGAKTAEGAAAVNTTKRAVVSHYTWLALRSVVKEEGTRGLFRGMWPTFMKVAPAVAVSVTVRDAVLGRL